jgi:DNA repair protein RadC
MYKEEPQDGWSVKRGRLFGKRLTADLRTILTRNDPFQNVATIIDALQQAIDQGIGVVFGYRSGTKGKFQNPFHLRDVALYTWEVSANSLKVNGYDQAVVRHNIQVLVENGYIKDIKDFERQLAEQGQKALADPEGRINPDGGAENTLMTAVFGLKESAENIRSQGIKDLLESGKLKKAYRSYDVEALAGIGRGRRKAFTFNYDNIRNNYNPFRQSDEPMFMPDSDAPIIESEMRKPYLQKVQNAEKVRENEVSSRQREFDFTEGSFQEGVAKRLPNASESDVSILTRLDEAQPVDFEKAFNKSDTISSIFKDKVEAPYNKPTSLVGKIVENPNDLAPLLAAFRHPYQEFLGCCVVDKNGKIQSANIITSGNIVSSIVPFQVILREAMRINDPTIYIWHNHPGGNPTPSAGDWGVTTKMGKLIKETSNITFGGHIVTNGDSFTFIDGDGATQTIELPERDLAIWEKVARNDLYNLSDADVTAQVASNLRQSAPEDYIHGIFLNRKNRVVGIQRINRNVENLNEQLAMGAIDNGATAIIISENQPYKTKNDLFAQEARLRQFFATRGLDLLDYSLSNMPSFAGAGYETILNRDDQKMIFLPDGGGINRMPPTMPSSRFMRPAMTRTMATTEQLDRFKR